MRSTTTFKRETNFLGRNGFMRCGGVDIMKLQIAEPIVAIAPITSRGLVGRCKIELPAESVEEVAENLVKTRNPELKICAFINASSIVPKAWRKWFWNVIAEKAPFCWGENNVSLVTAGDFARHCEERLDIDGRKYASGAAIARFLNKVRALGETYINLES